jgi:hypothetical protein
MQLRYLQTLTSIASDKSNTIIFPVSMDLMSMLTDVLKARNSGELVLGGSETEEAETDYANKAAEL